MLSVYSKNESTMGNEHFATFEHTTSRYQLNAHEGYIKQTQQQHQCTQLSTIIDLIEGIN